MAVYTRPVVFYPFVGFEAVGCEENVTLFFTSEDSTVTSIFAAIMRNPLNELYYSDKIYQ